jgi:hypothetical protein
MYELSSGLHTATNLFRPCSISTDWSSGMVPSRITSLIYINFDELERIPVQSWRNERALKHVHVD